jgi:3-oxoacyl-(acyl-carrier-protein) synthase
LFTKGPALASPLMFPNLVLNAPASYAAMEFGSTGANLTVSHGEISGEQALAVGCDLIRARRADVVLAGGGDELEKVVIDAYRRFGALSGQRGGPEWCSPYDVERNGLVLGEGAAIVVLESLAAARQRGATVYAEIEDVTRFAVRAPLYDWPRSAPAAVEPLQRLLAQGPQRGAADGGTLDTSNRLDLVCGAANSSRRLDACELDVLAGLFGETAATVTLTSIKGAIGEWGAAGAMTAVAACMALHTGRTPPLCNLRRAPADALFHFAPRAAMPQRLQRALLFAMARGGAAVAMVLRKVEGAG